MGNVSHPAKARERQRKIGCVFSLTLLRKSNIHEKKRGCEARKAIVDGITDNRVVQLDDIEDKQPIFCNWRISTGARELK